MGARSMLNFVPSEFIVPEKMETEEYRLRMLSIDDVEKDFEAVISSAEHVSKVWPDSGWPDGLTLKQNLIDLGWHEKEFQNRTSFAYTMVTLDESKVLGCVYFHPTTKSDHDVEVFMWVRQSELQFGSKGIGRLKVQLILAEQSLGMNGSHCPKMISNKNQTLLAKMPARYQTFNA